MHRLAHILLVSALVGCSAGADDSDVEPESYPSTFTQGKYRVTMLSLMPEDSGVDFDGDGTLDNNLPKALGAADLLIKDSDLSPEGFDASIAEYIADFDLNILADASYARGEVTLDLLSGAYDAETESMTIDAISYDGGGDPQTRLLGVFLDQVAMESGSDRAILPVPFVPGDPPSQVPLERMTLTGDLDGDELVGTITGVIPAMELADDVLSPLIPAEGSGGLSREQLLAALRTFAGLENIADIDLGDERRGVSCAFSVRAEPAVWTE
jgi:hypothetical protein